VAIRVLHYLAQDANAPRPARTAAGRAVKYNKKCALDPANGGLLVALVCGDSAPDADVYAVFVKLDLVISTPLNLAVHSFSMGRLFMPKDFSAEYQQTNPREMRDVTLSEVAHMALSEEVPEHLKQRNRAFLASIGGFNFQKKELRTMTWADFGFQVNAEPFLSTSVSSWVTLPGEVAECYLNQEQLNFKVVAEAVQVWKDASETCKITPQIQERNETGIKLLWEMYHDLKKTVRQQGVDFQTLCQPVEQGTFLPCEETAPGPADESGVVSGPEDSGDEGEDQPPVLTVSPISAPSKTGTPKGVVVRQPKSARVENTGSPAEKPKRKPERKGLSPVSERRAVRYGKRVIVSDEESEETPLQTNRGKGRPENAPLGPLSFTKMLGLGTKETHPSCDAALMEELWAAGAFGEEDENEFWADFPAEADGPDAPLLLEKGERDMDTGEKLQALLQQKVEREQTLKPAEKGEVSRRPDKWPEGLVQREETLLETTAGGNAVNPQARPTVLNGGLEEKGEEVPGPSIPASGGDLEMKDAPPDSPRKRKEEAPSPLMQEGGREEAKKPKKSDESKKKRKELRRAEKAKRRQEAAGAEGHQSEQQSSPTLQNQGAENPVLETAEGRAMDVDELKGEEGKGVAQEGGETAQPKRDAPPEMAPKKPLLSETKIKPLPKPGAEQLTSPPALAPAPEFAPVLENAESLPKPESLATKAQALLSGPHSLKQENTLAKSLSNLAPASIKPAKVSDQSTQTDLETPRSAEESWEVTFLANHYVRVEITVREANGRLRPPVEHMMPEEQFFSTPWAERCGFFRFQQGRIPAVLRRVNTANQTTGKKRHTNDFICRSPRRKTPRPRRSPML
jgi:hypothetical protein